MSQKVKKEINWFWKSKLRFTDPIQREQYLKYGSYGFENQGTYVKPEIVKRISFTEELRNSKGYDKYLKLKYS